MRRDIPALVSVVIPARDPGTHLTEQLDALNSQSYQDPFELVVADNGLAEDARDAVLEISKASSVPLRLQDASQRVGAAYARNTGVEAARGELIAFCDADDIVDRNWLAELVSASSNADIVAGRIARNDSPPKYLRLSPFAGSGSMAIWKDVFNELEGFDESMLGGEDVELSWRAARAGYELAYAPEARIWRRPRQSASGHFHQGVRNGYWDSVLMTRFADRGFDAGLGDRARSKLTWVILRTPFLVIPSRRPMWMKHSGYLYGMVGQFLHRSLGRLKRAAQTSRLWP